MTETRSLELNPALPCQWQEPSYLRHHLGPPSEPQQEAGIWHEATLGSVVWASQAQSYTKQMLAPSAILITYFHMVCLSPPNGRPARAGASCAMHAVCTQCLTPRAPSGVFVE